jgi:hypothetical protein
MAYLLRFSSVVGDFVVRQILRLHCNVHAYFLALLESILLLEYFRQLHFPTGKNVQMSKVRLVLESLILLVHRWEN